MEFSKKHTFLLVAGLLVTNLTGCFQAKSHKADDEGLGLASFAAQPITGKSETLQMMSGLSLPSQKRFTFSACLTERRTGNALNGGVNFVLVKNDQKSNVATDAGGCVSWTEELVIDPLADEAYLPYSRKLIAGENSNHMGTIPLNVAINPWNLTGGSPEIVDLSQGSIPSGAVLANEADVEARLKGQMTASSDLKVTTTKSLYFDRYSLTSMGQEQAPAQGTIQRTLEVVFQPKISIIDGAKKIQLIDLTDADLQAIAVLVATVPSKSSEENYAAWASAEAASVVKEGTNFRVKFDVSFASVLPSSAHYLLALKLAPKKTGPTRLGAFEVLLEVGSVAQLDGSLVLPTLIRDMNVGGTFSFDQKTQGLKALPQPAPAAQPVASEQAPATPAEAPQGN